MGKISKEKVIKKLLEYSEQGVIILGPSGECDTKLRVYANGGDLGKISLENMDKHEIHTKTDYVDNHLFEKSDRDMLYNFINKALENPNDMGEILCDDTYISCMLKATKHYGYKPKQLYKNQPIKTEGFIETTLISQQGKIKNENNNLLIYDMEYAIKLPTRTTENNKAKKSEPDFIVFDGKNIGIIELKYDADNMTGTNNSLKVHFCDFMDFIWNGTEEKKWSIVNESIKRLECLYEEGLIDESWSDNIAELRKWYDVNVNGPFCPERLWIGFYFVEGPHKERKNKKYKMIPCREYVEDEIRIQLGEVVKEARENNQNTKILYGYWKDDENMKLVFDKEIIVDKIGNISFKEL